MHDLTAMADRVGSLVRATTDDQLDDPTPCPDMTVGQVIAHLHGLSIAFRDAAHKFERQSPPPQGLELPDDWRASTPELLRELAVAWSEPAAWQGTTHAAGLTMAGDEAGAVALDEVVLHGWDLAVATDQAYTVTPEALDVTETFCASVPDDPSAREGLFGPRVPVADDAPQLERVLGLAGRDPAWSPPGSSD